MRKIIFATYLVAFTLGLVWGGSNIMLQIYAYSLGASYFEISLISSLFSLTMGFAQPIWGMLSDIIRKRKIFITLNGFLSVPIYLLLSYPNVWVIIILRILWAAIVSGIPVITLVIITSIVSKEKVGSWTGGFYSLNMFGFSAGMFTQGILYDIYGPFQTLFVYAIIFVLSIILFFILVDEKVIPTGVENIQSVKRERTSQLLSIAIFSRFTALKKGGKITIIFFIILLLMLGQGIMIGLLPIYMVESGLSNTYIGIIFSFLSLVGVFTSTIFGYLSDKIGRKMVLITGSLCFVAGSTILVILEPTIINFTLATITYGLGYSAINAAGPAYLSDITAIEDRGGAIGLFNSASSLGWGIGPIFSGIIATISGEITSTFVTSAVVCVFDTTLMVVFLKESLKKKASLGVKENYDTSH